MASGKVRSVSVVFQAFTDKFEKKVDSAGNKAAGFGKKVLAGVAGFVAARGLVGKFNSQFKELVQLSNTSKELEVSPKFLQGISLATEQLGFSFDKAKDVIREFNIRLGEARTGAGPAVNGLKLLGLTIEEFNSLNPEEGFLKVADALSKLEDPQVKLFAAGELFGGAGEDMIGLLNEGEEGLQKFIDKAEELSGPITQEDLEKVKQADVAIKEMGKSLDGLITKIIIEMTPAIESMGDAFTIIKDYIKDIGKAWTETQKFIERGALAFMRLTGQLTDEEYATAMAWARNPIEEEKQAATRQRKTIDRKPFTVEAKIANIKTFVEELSAGSSAAFRALNPTQQVDTQKQMVNEQKKTNSLLDEMIDSLPFQNTQNNTIR